MSKPRFMAQETKSSAGAPGGQRVSDKPTVGRIERLSDIPAPVSKSQHKRFKAQGKPEAHAISYTEAEELRADRRAARNKNAEWRFAAINIAAEFRLLRQRAEKAEAEVARLQNMCDEKAAIIKAGGHETDVLRSRASAAEARQSAAEHRAKRIVLDEELRRERDEAIAQLRQLIDDGVIVPG